MHALCSNAHVTIEVTSLFLVPGLDAHLVRGEEYYAGALATALSITGRGAKAPELRFVVLALGG